MRILGIVLAILGLIALGYAVSPSQAITEKVIEGISGRDTANTLWLILAGLTLVVGGGALALLSDKKP